MWRAPYFPVAPPATGGGSNGTRANATAPTLAPVPPAGGQEQAQVPFMLFLVLDPIICIALAWVVAAAMSKYQWQRFWAIFVGTAIVGASPFLMIPYHYAAVIAFIVVESIGESIWAPLFLRYSCEFTPVGREGVYFGLVGIVLFLGKLFGGLSGELMQRYCPAYGDCANGYMVWLIVGCVCLSTPLLLLLTCRWTWLRSSSGPLAPEGADMVELPSSSSTDDEFMAADADANKVDDFTYFLSFAGDFPRTTRLGCKTGRASGAVSLGAAAGV